MAISEEVEVRSTLVRMVDYLKMNGVTSVLTDLKLAENPKQSSMISSLVDTWIMLENVETNGESDRVLRLVKSRGMAHSNQVREFHITNDGIDLVPPYIGPAGALTGSARYAQEASEREEDIARTEEIERLKARLEKQRIAVDAEIEALRAEFEDQRSEVERKINEEERRRKMLEANREHLKALRTASGREASR